ncbi:alpha/beta hydrolase [Priestia megaterium]|nr:alpha/beta hydrolase [Priestia megaterium]
MDVLTASVTNERGDKISYTHIGHQSSTVCFMLAGSSYTYEKPIFHYLTMFMLERNVDVVHIHYHYNENILSLPGYKIGEEMMEDITPVMNEVYSKHNYNKTILIGKSLGTVPLSNSFMKAEEPHKDKLFILLTPLLAVHGVYKSLLKSNHKALIVVGDKDSHYNEVKVDKLREVGNEVHILPNATHSLDDYDNNPFASLNTLKQVVARVGLYLNE